MTLFWGKSGNFGKTFEAEYGFIIKRIRIILMRSTEYNSNVKKNTHNLSRNIQRSKKRRDR
jgi:hypothetical protein